MESLAQSSNVEEEVMPVNNAGLPPSDYGSAASDFLKYVLDSIEKLEQISHDIRGEVPVFKDNEIIWIEVKGRRILNEDGANKILFLIKGFFSKELAPASIPFEEAHKITEYTMQELKDTIALNAIEWGLDISLYSDLVVYLDNEIYLSLSRIKEGASGGIAKIIKPTYQRKEVYTPEKKESKGLFGLGGK